MDPKEKRRKEIIEAATSVFASKGYAGTLMADIAAQAGIAKGTIYEYFPGKQELFFEVFDWLSGKTWSSAAIRISALGGSASERMVSVMDTIIREWADQLEIFALVMEFWAASTTSAFRERFKAAFRNLYAGLREIVSSLIIDGIGRGEFREDIDIDATAGALVGSLDAILMQAWFDKDFDPLKNARGFMDVVLRGLSCETGT
jgi:AcrR family transcriptional regulator